MALVTRVDRFGRWPQLESTGLLTVSVRDERQGVGGWCGTGNAVGGTRGIGHLHLAESGEHAQQTAVQHGQVVDDEIELSRQMRGPISKGDKWKGNRVNWRLIINQLQTR